MTAEVTQLNIPYGHDAVFQGEILAKRLVQHFQPPPDLKDIASAIRTALDHPLEFPTIQQACVPGDKIVIALDPETPRAEAIIALLWKQLSAAGVTADGVTILTHTGGIEKMNCDPRSLLPTEVQQAMQLVAHDPSAADGTAYLASTVNGQRVYLAREIVEADLVIPIGCAQFDSLLGYRGEATVLYPSLSNSETIAQAIGQGHEELTPNDSRPLRQLADEVCWLLGTQFAISAIPGQGNHLQAVFSGSVEAVGRAAREELLAKCALELTARAETVLVAIDAGTVGHTWEQVSEVLDMARQLVERSGRIIVLTQLAEPLGPGLEYIREMRTAKDSVKAIRAARPTDYLVANRLAKAVDWANVYFRSELPSQVVEDLFMIPLDSDVEIQRLLSGDDLVVVIEGAQRVYASVTRTSKIR